MKLFNKGQREGLAKVADNLATAVTITGIVGGLVDQKLHWWQFSVLLVLFGIFTAMSLWLRRAEGDEDE